MQMHDQPLFYFCLPPEEGLGSSKDKTDMLPYGASSHCYEYQGYGGSHTQMRLHRLGLGRGGRIGSGGL